jgi:quinohemoprotein ethanol dehydrogenase
MQANKNGFFYVLDAANGKLLSAENFVPVDWAERIDMATGRPVESPQARYQNGKPSTPSPSAFGGHNWQPMAFSPNSKLVYIPAMLNRGYYAKVDRFEYLRGANNTGLRRLDRLVASNKAPATIGPQPEQHPGELLAWDPVAQKARWHVAFTDHWRSGVLATAGNLVFHSAGHQFMAFDAETGQQLWSYDTVANAIAPAISYAVDGEEFVALMVGWGGAGAFGANQPRRPGRLLVFKVGGFAKPAPYHDAAPQPILDVTLATPASGDATNGEATFTRLCANCHRSGAFLPDLTRSPAILDPNVFRTIVLEGALKARGMAPFSRFLNDGQAEEVRAHLLAAAKKTTVVAPTSATEHAQ